MSFNFQRQYPSGPNAQSPSPKQVHVQAVKLTYSDFTTGGTAAVKAVLPKDASIVNIRSWVKTQLAGGSISAATLSIGITGTATKFMNAVSVFGAAGVHTVLTPLTNIFQDANVETGDIPLLFTGTATTGNPTSGEIYILIEYVR